MKGYFRIEAEGLDFTVENIVTLQGLEYAARNIAGSNPVTLRFLVISDTADPPALDETSLGGNLQALSVTPQVSGRKIVWSGVFFPVNITIRRLGICANSNGSGLFATAATAPLSIPSHVRLRITYTLELLP